MDSGELGLKVISATCPLAGIHAKTFRNVQGGGGERSVPKKVVLTLFAVLLLMNNERRGK